MSEHKYDFFTVGDMQNIRRDSDMNDVQYALKTIERKLKETPVRNNHVVYDTSDLSIQSRNRLLKILIDHGFSTEIDNGNVLKISFVPLEF